MHTRSLNLSVCQMCCDNRHQRLVRKPFNQISPALCLSKREAESTIRGGGQSLIRRNRLMQISAVLILALIIYLMPTIRVDISWTTSSSGSKVLVADQLDLSSRNVAFRASLGALFERAGIRYDLVIGSNITVDFYRMLPSMGYRLIVLRVHSGLLYPISLDKPVYLFSGEKYSSSKYEDEQLNNELVPAQVTEISPVYFAVGLRFVERSMNGTFPGSVIIISGCSGLINTYLADALLSRGASAVISWDGLVTAKHTDRAFNYFMEDFVTNDVTIEQAVRDTMGGVGPDPEYESYLKVYPENAGRIRLSDLLSPSWPTTRTTTTTSELVKALALPASSSRLDEQRLQ